MRGLASQLPHGPAAATSEACRCCRRHCTACAAMLQRMGMVWATERGQQGAGTNEQGNRQHRGRGAMGELHAKLDETEGCRGRQAAAQRSATDSLQGRSPAAARRAAALSCAVAVSCHQRQPPQGSAALAAFTAGGGHATRCGRGGVGRPRVAAAAPAAAPASPDALHAPPCSRRRFA